jgi:galactose mutarotase-like enzyme
MSVPPSGRQYEIRYGDKVAVVVGVGGGVREYRVADRAVLDPYPLNAMCDGAHGTVSVPWPNRLGDGRYRFDGVDYQVALIEPEKSNAIHGLSAGATGSRSARAAIRSQTGCPFVLDVTVDYLLDDQGLTVTTTATNLGEQACPYCCGHHPYLSPGSGLIDHAGLNFTAGTRIVTDADRQLPTGTEPVAGASLATARAARLTAHTPDRGHAPARSGSPVGRFAIGHEESRRGASPAIIGAGIVAIGPQHCASGVVFGLDRLGDLGARPPIRSYPEFVAPPTPGQENRSWPR